MDIKSLNIHTPLKAHLSNSLFISGRRRYSSYTMVWSREGLQCASYGPTWTLSGGSIQLLLQTVYYEDSAYAGGSDDW